MSGNSLAGLFVTLGADTSPFAKDMIQAEYVASGSAAKIKEKLLTVATSLGTLRKEATQTKEALANAADFRVRGDAALDKLHQQLDGVRAAGTANTKTLDELSLSFEDASKGGNTYVQALSKVASDKNASKQVRQLAADLRDQAKEANLTRKELERYQATLNRQITQQRRTFTSTLRQAEKEENPHQVPQYAAASATARLLEGQVSIRAGERFLTGTLGLGAALQGIFPVIGGLAFVGMLDELYDRAQKAYDALKKLQNQPQIIADAFRQMNGPIAISNDELRITNDRLANQIAKLEGKPQNHLKEAIDEARLAADKLGESLSKDFETLQKLLQEHNVSAFQRLIGNVSTTDIQQDLFGKTGLGGVKAQVEEATRSSSKQQAQFGQQLDGAKTDAERKAIVEQSDKALDQSQRQITGILQPQIAKSDAHLADLLKQQEIYNRYRSGDAGLRFAAIEETRRTGHAPEYTYDPSSAIEIEKARNTILHETQEDAIEQIKNSKLNSQLRTVQGNNDAAALTRPYQDKLHELSAQLDGLNNQLASIGKSETAETLAKSWAKAQEEIAKLNDELAKHHQSLSLDQQVELTTLFDQQATTQAEIEWKTKLDQTTDSIQNRVASLKLLTDAIGKGADAQRTATVETQVMQTLGTKYNDPQWMKAHQADVQELRTQFGAQDDATRANQSKQAVEGLTNQIQLERSLAEVQAQGAEAIRLVTLAYRLRELAANNASAAQIKAEIDLANAQKQNKSAGNLANLAEELKATQVLSAAQLQGAEAYRKAQNELKYEQMAKQGASPEEIQQTRTVDAAKHQADVTGAALQTGLGYQNQLESLDQQIAALQQLKAQQGDSLAIEQSLKTLEQERAHIFAQQVSIVGTAKDGLHAYFQEMATQGVSSAQEVHDVFRNAFDSLNDSLAKMVAGQKVSWASFFSGIAEQLAKISLNNLEAKLGAVLAPKTAPGGQQKQASGGIGGILQGIGAVFGGFRADGGDVDSGKVHVVGEEGPELFIPDTDGTIIPADKTKKALKAFDNTQSATQLSSVSLATSSPSFLSVLAGAAGSGAISGIGNAGKSAPTPDDPMGHLPWNHGLPMAPKYSWWNTRAGKATSTFGALGVSAGLGVLSMLMNRPKDHHFKPGNAYSIPNFNGAYAEGGQVKKGMTHLVGEHGKELFIPKLPPAVKVRDTMPFGGYRAMGGDVDADKAYMVGEQGPEMWTPPTSGGSIVPNHALAKGGSMGDIYIDARNTDPAAVYQNVRRGMEATHQASVSTSMKSFTEYKKRTPEMSK